MSVKPICHKTPAPVTTYRPVFLLIPRIVRDRTTDQMVRVWGGGMLRRWSISERRWHYRSGEVG